MHEKVTISIQFWRDYDFLWQLKEVKKIIGRYGVDVAKKEEDGKSAVHIAARQSRCHEVSFSFVRALHR